MNGNPTCKFCYGRGSIRVPNRAVGAARLDPKLDHSIEFPFYKEKPCGCALSVPLDQVKFLHAGTSYSDRYGYDRSYHEEAVRRDLAHSLADALLTGDMIAFSSMKKTEADKMSGISHMRAEIGILTPATVSTWEDRISQRQNEIATAVVAKAAELIDGMYGPGCGVVYKHQAAEALKQAMKAVTEGEKVE